MLGSIRNFSKSFLAKIFVAIIALPFVLWGMGDVFTSGKQNVLVEINDEKISSKEFITYIQNFLFLLKVLNQKGAVLHAVFAGFLGVMELYPTEVLGLNLLGIALFQGA